MIPAIIPARGGSKGIPRKNIVDFCGRPLIAWSIEQALNSKYIDKVYVSTDDDEIADISKEYGAELIKRPREISTDTSSSEEALIHVLDTIGWDWEYIVFLQATSPLRESSDIDGAINLIKQEGGDSLFSAVRLADFFLWKRQDGKLVSWSYDYKNRKRRQDVEPTFLENGSIYVFKPEILRKYQNRLGGEISVWEMDSWKAFQIDKPEDLDICSFFMKAKGLINEITRY